MPPTTVLKISGTLLTGPSGLAALWQGVRRLRADGGRVVVVHGGGQQATALAERLGHTPTFVQGRRITSDLDLDVAQWALRGKLNTQIVAAAPTHGCTAVGLSGADGGTVQVSKRPPWTIDGETVDFGWVGDVERVDPAVLNGLLDAGVVPVVAPLGLDDAGQVYNVNADTIARAIAAALEAEQILFVTATGGVRRYPDEPASHLDTCDAETFQQGVDAGWIEGGMRVKLQTALDAVRQGIPQAVICAAGDVGTQARATKVVA